MVGHDLMLLVIVHIVVALLNDWTSKPENRDAGTCIYTKMG